MNGAFRKGNKIIKQTCSSSKHERKRKSEKIEQEKLLFLKNLNSSKNLFHFTILEIILKIF
jgi:hypothetical protein